MTERPNRRGEAETREHQPLEFLECPHHISALKQNSTVLWVLIHVSLHCWRELKVLDHQMFELWKEDTDLLQSLLIYTRPAELVDDHSLQHSQICSDIADVLDGESTIP